MYDYSRCNNCRNGTCFDERNDACMDCAFDIDTISIGMADEPTPLTELNELFI